MDPDGQMKRVAPVGYLTVKRRAGQASAAMCAGCGVGVAIDERVQAADRVELHCATPGCAYEEAVQTGIAQVVYVARRKGADEAVAE